MGQSLAIPRVIPNDWKRLDLIVNKIKMRLGRDSSPTFAEITLNNTGLHLLDTNASHDLIIAPGSDLTADRTLTLTTGDSDRTITLSGNPTLGDWFDQSVKIAASPTHVGLTLTGLTNNSLIYPSSGVLTSLGVATNGQLPIGSTGTTPVLATLTGSTDRISVTNGAGSITLDLGSNTQTLLDSFNGIFLETIDFTISESGGTVTGSLEQDSGGDLIQRFSDGYSILDCTPALTIDLTAYVGTDVIPVEVFVYILQSAKTVMAASNSDWPVTEHIKVANLVLRSAATTGTDGGALVNRNWNDHAQSADSQGHITHIEQRIRQEPTQWDSGVALTLKDSAGNALTTSNSSTAVELVTSVGTSYQLHKHTFAAIDMYITATDKAHIVNQPTDEGGAYETTVALVTDVTHYVDGTAAGVAIGVNKYFNLVMWGVQNRTGEISHLMINLPIGQYTNEAAAIADVSGYSVFDLPAAFKGVGFLIARLTFRLIAGAQWTYIAQEDLRGQIPPSTAGVSITTTAHDLLANLDFASAGHTGFQAQGDVLDDLNATGANTFAGDPVNDFLVGTAAGTLVWQYGATARTSIGLGTTNNPTFAALTVTTINGLGVKYTATGNIAIGDSTTLDALDATPTYNIAIGNGAGSGITDGDDNIFIGYQAGYSKTTSGHCIAIGYEAAYNGAIIGGLTAIGYQAMKYHGSGNGNTVVGYQAGLGDAGGAAYTYNTFIGEMAGRACNDGGSNVCLGKNAGHELYDGHRNILLGFAAGYTQTDNTDLLIVDNQQRANVATDITNAILYGVMAAAPANQTLRINAVTTVSQALTGLSTAAIEGASVTIGKASTTTGTLVLHDSNSANTITLTVPDISAGSLSFTLPPTDGANTNVLQTNGSGVLTWAAAAGGGAFTSKCSIYRNATQAITTGTWTKVQLNTEDYDTDGEFDSTTNYRFEPDVTGYYAVSACISLTNLLTTKYMNVGIYKNGTLWKVGTQTSGIDTQDPRIPISCDMYLLDTDWIELYVYHNHGSDRDIESTGRYTYMDVHRFA